MITRRHGGALVAAVAALVLTACAQTETLVQLEGDYPAYANAEALVADATIVVEGTVVSRAPTVLMPRFEGDDPEENPLSGLSADDQQRAIREDAGVPATVVTIRIDTVYVGAATAGHEVRFVQTGATIDGVTYAVEDEPPLAEKSEYLLFGTESIDGTFAVLGGAAGAYLVEGDSFIAISPAAPVEELSRAAVQELLAE